MLHQHQHQHEQTDLQLQDRRQQRQSEEHSFRLSLPSHLLWRSALGAPAAWSGSSLRGVNITTDSAQNGTDTTRARGSMIQSIPTDKRMFNLPKSLRDFIVQDMLSSSSHSHSPPDNDNPINNSTSSNLPEAPSSSTSSSTQPSLLSHPRIVGAAPPGSRSTVYSSASAGRAFSRTDNNNGSGSGISCMDIDRGNDGTLAGSPSRYLLVGSGGGDCSISLYDLSYFGSDRYLYHHHPSQSSSSSNKSSRINSQYLHDGKSRIHTNEHDQSSITHRPIARSLRHNNDRTISEENASGVPSGHRQPLLGVNWYPGDVYGAFVSASISGEILVWDAKNFVPVFATYAHVYTGTGTGGTNHNEYKKSVAPLQCMDLPKTPESCPHGNALLALGLGGGARGVIQLCDAFRGGSATHELIGHGSGGGSGGGGGVNAVAWDPYHPFRLASGGDDCTVRLWDIRKAGARACLGVLDRENDMNIAYSNSGGNGGGGVDSGYYPSRKKQKARLVDSNNSGLSQIMYDGVESHGGPVTALAFAPGGDDLVSTGLDGRIHHWDLRPDSCYVSSVAAISSGNKRSSIEMIPGGGGMDPCVATGGRLMPTCFTGLGGGMNKLLPGSSSKSTSRRPSLSSRRTRRASLAVIQPGSRSTTTLLSTSNTGNSSKGQIVGHSLFGRRGKEPGGLPDFVLNGHLADVTCLVPIDGMWDNLKIGNCGDGDSTVANHVNFLTGGRDGMVLSWGSSRRRSRFASRREFDDEDARRHGSRPSYEWQNRFRCGNGTEYCHPESNQDEGQPFEDTDHW